MFQEREVNVFDFDVLKAEYNVLIKKWDIIQGTVLKSKVYFLSWSVDPLDPEAFESGSIFTVVDIVLKNDEYVLYCFQNNKIVELDSFVFFFNSANLHLENCTLEETFSIYFEKIL